MAKKVDFTLPCLICGDDDDTNPTEAGDSSNLPVKNTGFVDLRAKVGNSQTTAKLNDDTIFQYFLKLFHVDSFVERNKSNRNVQDKDWSFRFCDCCRLQLGNLLQLQIKLDELKKQIKDGAKSLRLKIQSSEVTFQSEEIYECYPRYMRVRSKIINKADSQIKDDPILNEPVAQLKEEEPESPSMPDFHDDFSNSDDESEREGFPEQQPTINKNGGTQPRKNLRFVEYPEKQSVLYGDFTFQILESMERGKRQVKCSICDLVLPYTKGWIRGHVFRVHTDSYVCTQCPSRFARGRHLRAHVRIVHEGIRPKYKIIECTICGKPISARSRKAHEWSHKSKQEKEEARKDPEISKSFLNEKKFQCDQCECRFSGSSHLRKHQDRKHKAPEERRELCSECGGSYLNLQIHLRHKHGKGEVEGVVNLMKTCLEPGCGKKFLNLGALTRHKNRVHKNLKPFECTQCEKCFKHKRSLLDHMKSHTLKIDHSDLMCNN